ncbi:MAG: hypothetical protein JXB85_10515 [Anaerolineales bacterium]|nr:hypothetical protein [Anaerolineales bacterium]
MSIKVEVLSVSGTCNAGLQVGDTYHLDNVDLRPQGHNRTCTLLQSAA